MINIPEEKGMLSPGSRVVLTGGHGFLGWHLRAALREHGIDPIMVAVGRDFDLNKAVAAFSGAERIIHLAGINRAADTEISQGNILFAEQIAEALRRVETPPVALVYANSTQATNNSVYGIAKARAADILAAVANEVASGFVNLMLPNLFGEHGKPFYNAVTATFCHLLANGGTPKVESDKELTLLHAQDAADLLIGARGNEDLKGLCVEQTVSGLLNHLEKQSETYMRGEIPDLASKFDRDLFNTYRSYTIESHTPLKLTRHADARGSFFETIRSHGGSGQSSFSTTVPGITRGDHFHRRKVERFVVLSGAARISMRKLFSTEVLNFDIDGERPFAIDMPTMWTHKITNTGSETLYTMFWTNDLFDPSAPDTIAEEV